MPAPAIPLRQALGLAALAGRRLLAVNLLLLVVQGVLPLLGLLAMQLLLDAIATGIQSPERQAAFRTIGQAVALAAVVAAAGSLLRAVVSQASDRLARLVADRCADRLQRHAARLDLLQVEDPAHADLLHRAGSEAGQRPIRIVYDLSGLVLAAVTLLALGGALATVTPLLPLLVGAAAAPQAVARLRHARALFAWQQQHTEDQRRALYLGGLLTGRSAAKDLRLLDLGPGLADELQDLRTLATDGQLRLARTRAWHEALSQIVAGAAMFLAYLYLGWLALDGALTIGGFLLQAQAVQRTQNAIRDGLLAHSGLRESRLFLAHVFAFLALQPRIVAPPASKPVPVRPAAGLECRAVRFAYPGRPQPVLEDLDLTLRPGERVALVGGNGAGKSTIVRLLARLCDPDAGSVCYGGIDLREFDPQQYRARLSVFCQDAAGFEFTARRNLALGALEVDEAAMLAAADRLGLRARLEALPHGLDTQLGRAFHGAVELSAGEWRKLLLARALARPADVLLLDEPFAFLDQDGQQRLAAALTGAGRERTVLIVDPRPQALTFVDRILVCEGGRIRAAAAPPAVRGERQ